MQMMYVDKARNVNIGGRDLKTDVSPFDHYRHHNILMELLLSGANPAKEGTIARETGRS